MEAYIPIIITFLIGVFFPIVGTIMFLTDDIIKKEGKKVVATVIEIKEKVTAGGIEYKLVLEFNNHKGETIVQELNNSSSFKPKQEVPFRKKIYYLEINNKTKIIPNNTTLKNAISFGILIIGLAVFYLFTILFKNEFLWKK